MNPQLSNINRRQYHRDIATWYSAHGRHDLPWRNTDDPYHIYLSEIMLQQTQVKTVLEKYYQPFLTRFPTLAAIAAAEESEVLKAWEGLGYYTRAKNLYKCSQIGKNTLPKSLEELLELPGIGKNTAHAILAFAYKQAVPVMEANVKRVLHRLLAEEAMTDKALWRAAQVLVDENDPYGYNQAMMDIGAMICTPRQPDCGHCPLASHCAGRDHAESYPAKAVKKQTPVRHRHLIAIRNRHGHYYMAPRQTRFLGGLYGFPEFEPSNLPKKWANGEIQESKLRFLGKIKQVYSHFTLDAELFTYDCPKNTGDSDWYSPEQMRALPTSRADQKAFKLLF